jgi:nucleotide-binding universal stress UspA family protein
MAFDPKHIVVPVAIDAEGDMSLAEQAVFAACDLAVKFSSKITLLHLVAPLKPGTSASIDFSGRVYQSFMAVLEARIEAGRLKVKKLEETAQERGIKVEARVMESLDSIHKVILEAAADLDADLLIVGSHGYSGLSLALFGSVAEKIARHAPMPVLLFHQMPPEQK